MDIIDQKQGIPPDYWWFEGKKELIRILLKGICRDGRNMILDIGTGTGEYLDVFSKFGRIIVLDLCTDALIKVPKSATSLIIRGDVENLPIKSNIFDIVIMLDVLEHLENDKKSVGGLCAVLKQGGFFVVSVPAFPFLFGGHDKALGHERRYSKKAFMELLQDKFSIIKLIYWNSILFIPLSIYRVIKKHLKVNKAENVPEVRKIHPALNNLFLYILRLENSIIARNFSPPFGVSMVAIAKNCPNFPRKEEDF